MSSPRFTVHSHKNPVIIELGAKWTKIGFAGEPEPVAIIRSCGTLSGGKTVDLVGPCEYPIRIEALSNFMKNVYSRILLTNPKERKVTMVLDVFGREDVERAIMTVFLSLLEVPALSFVAPHMTVFPALGVLNTGLVVDMGSVLRIIPVAQNAAIVGAWDVLPQIGYNGLLRYVREKLPGSCKVIRTMPGPLDMTNSDETNHTLVPDSIENIIADLDVEDFTQDLIDRWLVCTTSARGLKLVNDENYSDTFRPFPDLKHHFRMGQKCHDVVISGRFLENAMEIFFQPSIDGHTLPSAMLDVILKCPIDLRKAMMQHILVVGGMADVKNFVQRLNSELYTTVKNEPYSRKFAGAEFRFVSCGNVPPSIVAWRGCSALVQGNYVPDSAFFTREELMLRSNGKSISHLLKEWSFVGKDRRMTR